VRTSEVTTLHLFEKLKTLKDFIASSRSSVILVNYTRTIVVVIIVVDRYVSLRLSRDEVKESLTVDRENALVEDETDLKEAILRK